MKRINLCLVTLTMTSMVLSLASCQSQGKGSGDASEEKDTTEVVEYTDEELAEMSAAAREASMEEEELDTIGFDDNSTESNDNMFKTIGTNGTMRLEKIGYEGNSMSPNTYYARFGNEDETFLRFNCYPHSKFGKKDFAELTQCDNLKESIANVSVLVPSYVDLDGKQYKVERVTIINSERRGYPTAGRLVIPSTVENIRIWGWTELKEVVLNDGIEELNERAFRGCPDLESIVLPNSLKKIGKLAFENCSGLKKIHIPSSVNDVSEGAAFVGLNKGVIIEVENGCEALNDLKPINVEIRGRSGYEHYTFNPEDINIVYAE